MRAFSAILCIVACLASAAHAQAVAPIVEVRFARMIAMPV